MAVLILARHGRTGANAAGVLAGRSPGVHLDDTGRDQVREAAARLAEVPLVRAVTSPLERCRETSRILLQGHEVRARTDRRLSECDYGEWTGEKIATLARKPLWRTVQAQPSAAVFPGGESLQQMSGRAVACVREHDAEVEGEHGPDAVWVATSHGDVIKAILADALGLHLDAFQRIVVDTASLSVVRYTPTRSFVVTMNSRAGSLSHLRPAKTRRSRTVARGDAVIGGETGATPAPH
ncbi:MAG: MSMEG_4193 family putative phosphomutase [Marmoricola sp.]